MSTTLKPQAPPPPEQEDPWRLGWRYVPQVGPNGEITCEQIPLTEDGLLFPEEGDFVVTNECHHIDCNYLKAALTLWAARRESALALADHRVDWEVSGLRPLGPDVVVFDGLRDKWDIHRGTLPVKTFGARTLLVIEVTSPDSRANDLGVKVEFYHRVGALFYAIVDRHETRSGEDGRLLGYRADPATPDRFVEAEPDDQGRLWLESVRLWLAMEDDRAVLYDENGDRIPDYAEAIRDKQSAEARIAAAEARTKELEAQLQLLRGNLNGGPPNGAAP